MNSTPKKSYFWKFFLISIVAHAFLLTGTLLLPLYQVPKPRPITASIGVRFQQPVQKKKIAAKPAKAPARKSASAPTPKKEVPPLKPVATIEAAPVVTKVIPAPKKKVAPKAAKQKIAPKKKVEAKKKIVAAKSKKPAKPKAQPKLPKPKPKLPPKPKPQSLPSFKLNTPRLLQSKTLPNNLLSPQKLIAPLPVIPDRVPIPRSKITYSESDFKPSQTMEQEAVAPSTQAAQMPNLNLALPRISSDISSFDSIPVSESTPTELRTPTPPEIAPLNVPALPEVPQTLVAPTPAQKFPANTGASTALAPGSVKLDPLHLSPAASQPLLQALPQTTQTPTEMLSPIAPPEAPAVPKNIQIPVRTPRNEPAPPESITPHSIAIPGSELLPGDIPAAGTSSLRQQHLIRRAQDEYNLHIKQSIRPKFDPRFSPDAFVKVELRISVSGRVLSYKVVESSGHQTFDLAVNLAIQNTKLNPLPENLAKNPPYVVLVHVTP